MSFSMKRAPADSVSPEGGSWIAALWPKPQREPFWWERNQVSTEQFRKDSERLNSVNVEEALELQPDSAAEFVLKPDADPAGAAGAGAQRATTGKKTAAAGTGTAAGTAAGGLSTTGDARKASDAELQACREASNTWVETARLLLEAFATLFTAIIVLGVFCCGAGFAMVCVGMRDNRAPVQQTGAGTSGNMSGGNTANNPR